jgi:hypothetical protein
LKHLHGARPLGRIGTKPSKKFPRPGYDSFSGTCHISNRSILQREIPPDTSLEYYRRHHIKLERLEATVRNREKAKLAHDYHHLKARLVELQQLDTSGFRGDTPAEQEKDKVLVLAAAKKLLENQRMKGKVEDKDLEGAEEGVAEAGDEDVIVPAKASTRPSKKKKESKWEYYPADFDLDGELVADSSKKKKPKKKVTARSDRPATGESRKRKRDVAEMDYIFADEDIPLEPEVEEDEYIEGPPVAAQPKKTKSAPAQKRSAVPPKGFGLAAKDKEKDEKASKLLDAARKYKPQRPPRDLNPFGAPLPELDFVDFELPNWLGWKFYDVDAGEEVATETHVDEPMGTPVDGADAMDVTGEFEIPVEGQRQDLGDEHSVLTTGEDEAPEQDDGALQSFLPGPESVARPFSMIDDAESSGLSDLTDEDEDEDADADADAEGEDAHDEEKEELEEEEEHEEEEDEEYLASKPGKPKRSIGRSYSSMNKKTRRR